LKYTVKSHSARKLNHQTKLLPTSDILLTITKTKMIPSTKILVTLLY